VKTAESKVLGGDPERQKLLTAEIAEDGAQRTRRNYSRVALRYPRFLRELCGLRLVVFVACFPLNARDTGGSKIKGGGQECPPTLVKSF
jgi:hypothetical protein